MEWWAAVLAVQTLIIGVALGWYARTIHNKLLAMYAAYKDRIETPSGVVRPIVTRGQTRGMHQEPIDLTAKNEPGITMRPSPSEITAQNMREREKRIRES